MFRVILSKMKNKKWFTFCLLFGVTLTVAVFVSHPMFEKGAHNELLKRSLASYAGEEHNFPAAFSREENIHGAGSGEKIYSAAGLFGEIREREQGWQRGLGLEILESQQIVGLADQNADSSLGGRNWLLKIAAMRDMGQHVEIVKGENFTADTEVDTAECVISETAMDTYGMVVGEELTFPYMKDGSGEPLTLVVKGIFKDTAAAGDPFWYWDQDSFGSMVFVSEQTWDKCVKKNGRSEFFVWDAVVFDDGGLTWENASSCLRQVAEFRERDEALKTPLYDLLSGYERQRKNLSRVMWVLELPFIVLVLLFICMVTGQMLQREEGEISVIRSRGATGWQVVKLYFYQAVLLSVAGLLPGGILGILLCQIAAGTDGFLSFSGRNLGSYGFNLWTIPYGLAACGITVLFLTVPVFWKLGITVTCRPADKRKERKPVWERFWLEIPFLGLSLYLLYNYHRQGDLLAQSVLAGELVDPVIFLNESLFLVACGLTAIRVSHLLIRAVGRIGGRHLKPAAYVSFLQTSRTFHSQNFLAVFLIMTIAGGIFNANMARTINVNRDDRIAYDVGCDARLMEKWDSHVYFDQKKRNVNTVYTEPDFEPYRELVRHGQCESVTRVMVDDGIYVTGSSTELTKCRLMGIHTKEFGETAKLQDGLNSTHWFHALNELAKKPEGVIISSNLAKQCGFQVGDEIMYTCYADEEVREENKLGRETGEVCAILDAFPGFDRYGGEEESFFLAANYAQVVRSFGLRPYEVWMRLPAGGDASQIPEAAGKRVEDLEMWRDCASEIRESKSSPLVQITNGLFTMGFLVSVLICAVGFFVYWILSIQGRSYSFGIYRAMGMSMREIYIMLLYEQGFCSLLPMLEGGGLGLLASALFARLIALVYLPEKHSVAIRLYMYGADFGRMAVLWGVLLFFGIFAVWHIVKRIQIAKVLKMGEV